MRKPVLKAGLAVSLIALVSAAAAQTPPSALSAAPGITFEGQVGGMDVWSVPGHSDLFAVFPDGQTILRGAIFSGSGRDIGSAYTGTEPTRLFPETAQNTMDPAPVTQTGITTDIPLVNTGPATGFASLRGPDSCQSPIFGAGPVLGTPQVAGWDEAGRGNPPAPQDPAGSRVTTASPALADTGLIDGSEVAREAQDALEGFDQEERRALLLDLVNGLRSATTQEEFLLGIASWRAKIDEMRVERGMSRLYTSDGASPLPPVATAVPATTLSVPEITVTELPAPDTGTVTGTGQDAVPVAPVTEDPGPVSPELPLEEVLLEDVRKNALWFSVGANDVPAVYAFLDPSCPFSASAVAALSEQIGSGELQLRVVLAPVISERSAGLVAGILSSEKPPLTFFDHEIALSERGRSDLTLGSLSDLPAPVQAGVQRNFNMIRDYGIPGVPFFVYDTAEGARVVSGAPDGLGFPGALVDPYSGTK